MAIPLPEYDFPPVAEMVLGVEFAPTPKWSIVHYGLYWNEIRQEFPEYQIHPPLARTPESIGLPDLFPTLHVGTVPDGRCWYITEEETRLIQLQNDRFIFNWRKLRQDVGYPRYSELKSHFELEWMRFCAFLDSFDMPRPEIQYCEVTYLNHIESGPGWSGSGDLSSVTDYLQTPATQFLPVPETTVFHTRFQLLDQDGHLNITLQPGFRFLDGKELLILNLTARGKPASTTQDDMFMWFDRGHEAVVKGFSDFASEEMQSRWGRRTHR